MLFIRKPNDSLRLYINYRGFNKVIIKNNYPLLLLSETLERFIGTKYFTKINIRNTYYRIRVREGDK
jgi:hypothetical protein